MPLGVALLFEAYREVQGRTSSRALRRAEAPIVAKRQGLLASLMLSSSSDRMRLCSMPEYNPGPGWLATPAGPFRCATQPRGSGGIVRGGSRAQSSMVTLLAFLICIGTALVGGVFFAFSTFVMKALAQLPPAHGIGAMQRINVIVVNPLFLGLFLGTAVVAVISVVAGSVTWGTPGAALLLVAGVTYLVGSLGVTVGFNIPRNDHLASLEAESAEAASYWPVYLREWLFWNHVRTVASASAAACAGAALLS